MLSGWLFQELRHSLLIDVFKYSPQCLRTRARIGNTGQTGHFQQHCILRRCASSSSTRWKTRQGKDSFAKEAKVKGLKSRAAFKLLEMNEKYKLFHAGDTVVDLGYAPGSWSQVAINRTSPGGRVVGIDIIPAQPPRGVSTIQGNFLSPEIQAEVRAYIQDWSRGRSRQHTITSVQSEEGVDALESGYIDLERRVSSDESEDSGIDALREGAKKSKLSQRDLRHGRVVDVVLSDMSAPWDQTDGFNKNSISNPYNRMMNTSGVSFKDHVGSMVGSTLDLCNAALTFAFDTLKTGGHFVCKFYQGGEDKELEKRLKRLFKKVHREKPESSRAESKESYFVATKRKEDALREDVVEIS
ncbi:FtsJ-domain-containing protein [Pseudovirgaria hyperparasitica]|uniref:rRNA methyltransferase 2, mitochondrial n=1 Tax=Pseudovirgaria hyperparasitica TaxID=470096 RepID=A0A6A6W0Y8_9PEZI|nr:FtsJ-domain-containing protein [Pseudovirgaria hyperparasitica]KAF2755799.1 FtsJ-domain-containing protein [Pseudovirgaria hyperparasitica]